MNPIVSDPKERVGRSRLARLGNQDACFVCGNCAATTEVSFSTYDYHMAAALQAGVDGVDINDEAGRAFDDARPLLPGERGLDHACEGCRLRFRIVATGGEQDRDGGLEYLLHAVVEMPSAISSQAPDRRTMPIAAWILVLVVVAVGGAFLMAAVQAEERRRNLDARGVRVSATVVGETLRRRAPASIDVAFQDQKGKMREASFEVPLASGWKSGDKTIAIIYDPNSPELAVAASGGLRRPWAFAGVGVALIIIGPLLAFQLWRVNRRRQS